MQLITTSSSKKEKVLEKIKQFLIGEEREKDLKNKIIYFIGHADEDTGLIPIGECIKENNLSMKEINKIIKEVKKKKK